MYNSEPTVMASPPDLRHLWNRGLRGHDSRQNWYLKLPIPKALRKQFPRTKSGNEQIAIIRSLNTGDLVVARRTRDELVVRYRRVFDRMSAGEKMTPDQIEAAVSLDLEGITEQSKAQTLQVFPIWFRRLAQKHQISPDDELFQIQIEQIAKSRGIQIPPNSELYKTVLAALVRGHQAAQDAAQARVDEVGEPATKATPPVINEQTETIKQAAEACFTEMQRDPSTAVRQNTIDGHRQHVGVFVDRCGDLQLTKITRAMASDFLDQIGKTNKKNQRIANRTINKYSTTLACVFRSAKDRGRFSGDNPFDRQRRKVSKKTNRVAFEVAELQTLFDALPREIKPTRHSPKTALPWAALIAAFTGMRLEEITQLKAADIHVESTNGGTTTVIDIHNGTGNNLKNESAPRLVPVHSQLVAAGLLDYVKALPEGSMLFPGLTRRKSKGNKIGPRVGELFGDKLEALNLKRPGLDFHSFRHTVSGRLDAAGVRKSDAERIMGHTVGGETFRTYSTGPGLKVLAGVIEVITYPGLKL
jgi:integrase